MQLLRKRRNPSAERLTSKPARPLICLHDSDFPIVPPRFCASAVSCCRLRDRGSSGAARSYIPEGRRGEEEGTGHNASGPRPRDITSNLPTDCFVGKAKSISQG